MMKSMVEFHLLNLQAQILRRNCHLEALHNQLSSSIQPIPISRNPIDTILHENSDVRGFFPVEPRTAHLSYKWPILFKLFSFVSTTIPQGMSEPRNPKFSVTCEACSGFQPSVLSPTTTRRTWRNGIPVTECDEDGVNQLKHNALIDLRLTILSLVMFHGT